jgi:CO/xanthine dehydrogenase FAD-binding subunit
MQLRQSMPAKENWKMERNNHTVLIAKTLSDIFYHLKTVSALQVLGGGTRVDSYNEKAVSLRSIAELKTIEKHERYIDFGAAVTISQMLEMGRTNMPSILYDALASIGTRPIRNLATLGGNICAAGQKLTLYAPLLALDARLELRNQAETKYIPFSKFNGVPEDFVLTQVRVPVDDWEVAIFRRIGLLNRISPFSASFAFLVDTQKNIIANIKIAFAGSVAFRSHELENKIIGSRLPLKNEFIASLVQEAERMYKQQFDKENPEPVLKMQFLSLLQYSLGQLT